MVGIDNSNAGTMDYETQANSEFSQLQQELADGEIENLQDDTRLKKLKAL